MTASMLAGNVGGSVVKGTIGRVRVGGKFRTRPIGVISVGGSGYQA